MNLELERTISAADKRVDSIKYRLDYMRKEYEAAGRIIKPDENVIRVQSPEVFLSPRKYEPEDDETDLIEKSPTYTARSFKIQSSDECFDVNKYSSQSQDSLQLDLHEPIIHHQANLYTKLWRQNPLEDVDLINNIVVDETIGIKSKSARDDDKVGKKRKIRVVKRSNSKSTTTSKYANILPEARRLRKVKRRGNSTHYYYYYYISINN